MTSRLMFSLALVAFAAMLVSAGARASASTCDAYFQASQEVSGSTIFDPFEPMAYERVVRVSVRNDGEASCSLRLRALNPALGPRQLPGSELSYRLFDPDNMELENDQASISGAYDFVLPAGSGRDLFIRMVVDRPQFAEPLLANTADELILSDQSETATFDTLRLSLNVDIASRAQINLAGIDAAFDRAFAINQISFGTLEPGLSRTVYLQIRANEDVLVHMDSRNGGVLQEVGGGSGQVPYSATLAGTPVNLDGTGGIPQPSPSSLDGLSLPLRFEIEPFGTQPSNRYRDRVTITVTAQPG